MAANLPCWPVVVKKRRRVFRVERVSAGSCRGQLHLHLLVFLGGKGRKVANSQTQRHAPSRTCTHALIHKRFASLMALRLTDAFNMKVGATCNTAVNAKGCESRHVSAQKRNQPRVEMALTVWQYAIARACWQAECFSPALVSDAYLLVLSWLIAKSGRGQFLPSLRLKGRSYKAISCITQLSNKNTKRCDVHAQREHVQVKSFSP